MRVALPGVLVGAPRTAAAVVAVAQLDLGQEVVANRQSRTLLTKTLPAVPTMVTVAEASIVEHHQTPLPRMRKGYRIQIQTHRVSEPP